MNTNRREVKRYYKPMAFNKRRGSTLWFSTSNVQYAEALTYAYWQISGINNDNFVMGDVQVTYYIKFRKPVINQV